MTGSVKRFNGDRGFGWITDDAGKDWFFHKTVVDASMEYVTEGQRVDFDPEDAALSPRGLRAKAVRASAEPF